MPVPRRHPDDIRTDIVRAAVRVIGEAGMGALTHRAVAAEAGVSLSSTTYHFASKGAIVAAAMTAFADGERRQAERMLAGLRTLLAEGARPTTAAIVELLVAETAPEHRHLTRAGYELQLQAVDDPELQPIARGWFDAVAAVMVELLRAVGSATPELDARIVVATIDGLRLDALTTAPSAERTAERRATFERLVAMLDVDLS